MYVIAIFQKPEPLVNNLILWKYAPRKGIMEGL